MIEARVLALEFAGVIIEVGSDLSDVGGEGGVGASEVAEDTDFVGGVAMVGDDAVVDGECSDMDDCGRGMVAARGVGFLSRERSDAASALRNLSCLISASTLRSESSSRSLWVSIRSCSRSCSPLLISSSNITLRSIATLNFDSKSSREELVLRACLSKSSF